MTYKAFFIGDPLLDMQVTNGEALLQKYDLKSNDAIRAEEKHRPLQVRHSCFLSYEEMVRDWDVTYVSGGGAQTAARAAAYLLPPESIAFTGCVGDDDKAELLKAANKKEGVESLYLIKKGESTGVCAAVITGADRSLVTDLQAASKFEKSFLASPEIAPLIEDAQLVYVEGYFLTHSGEAVRELARRISSSSKTFVLNLSAPFLPERFGDVLSSIIPYTDIIIANESEAKAWSAANPTPFSSLHPAIPTSADLPAIASRLALLPKSNASKPRIVVVTQGSESTILVSSDKPDKPRIFPVALLREEEIVDTNAAGDAFAGGFLAAYISGRSLDECVEVGHRMGAMCVGQVGPNFKWPKVPLL